MPYWPLPAQTTIQFGEPIAWPEIAPEQAEDPEVLERCYREVESRLQRALDGISAGRIPLFGCR